MLAWLGQVSPLSFLSPGLGRDLDKLYKLSDVAILNNPPLNDKLMIAKILTNLSMIYT